MEKPLNIASGLLAAAQYVYDKQRHKLHVLDLYGKHVAIPSPGLVETHICVDARLDKSYMEPEAQVVAATLQVTDPNYGSMSITVNSQMGSLDSDPFARGILEIFAADLCLDGILHRLSQS